MATVLLAHRLPGTRYFRVDKQQNLPIASDKTVWTHSMAWWQLHKLSALTQRS